MWVSQFLVKVRQKSVICLNKETTCSSIMVGKGASNNVTLLSSIYYVNQVRSRWYQGKLFSQAHTHVHTHTCTHTQMHILIVTWGSPQLLVPAVTIVKPWRRQCSLWVSGMVAWFHFGEGAPFLHRHKCYSAPLFCFSTATSLITKCWHRTLVRSIHDYITLSLFQLFQVSFSFPWSIGRPTTVSSCIQLVMAYHTPPFSALHSALHTARHKYLHPHCQNSNIALVN